MDRTFIFGLGLALVSLFLQYAVKEMPGVITYSGLILGAIFMIWALMPGAFKLGVPELLMLFGACLFVAGAYLYIVQKGPPPIPPEVEEVRDRLRPNGPLRLGITTSPDGLLMTSAQVQLNMIHDAPRAITYTVHRFRGSIEGVEMQDVTNPNPGGELMPGEGRRYAGASTPVSIAGPFSGEVEWEIK
jgi:hypothetical protein